MIEVMSLPLSRPPAADVSGSTDKVPAIMGVLRELARGFVDPYRPERHYMRGPGPRWRESHGWPSTQAAQSRPC